MKLQKIVLTAGVAIATLFATATVNANSTTTTSCLPTTPIPISPQLIGIESTYYWQIDSTSSAGVSYGGWRNGPSGKGKAVLTFIYSKTQTTSYDLEVSDSLTGVDELGTNTLNASLGVHISDSEEYGVNYSIEIPSGKREQIIFRPAFQVTKVVEREWCRTGTFSQKLPYTSVAYVYKFSNWDYSYKNI